MALRERPVQAALTQFLASGLDDVLARPAVNEAERRALALFESVVATVPAYRAFLAEHDIDPATVRTIDDFRTLPLLTKDNYLRRHLLAQLCRGGELAGCDMVAVSSGSTGEPTFWPWCASRWAPGSAACTPRVAAATWPPRDTRSR